MLTLRDVSNLVNVSGVFANLKFVIVKFNALSFELGVSSQK